VAVQVLIAWENRSQSITAPVATNHRFDSNPAGNALWAGLLVAKRETTAAFFPTAPRLRSLSLIAMTGNFAIHISLPCRLIYG